MTRLEQKMRNSFCIGRNGSLTLYTVTKWQRVDYLCSLLEEIDNKKDQEIDMEGGILALLFMVYACCSKIISEIHYINYHLLFFLGVLFFGIILLSKCRRENIRSKDIEELLHMEPSTYDAQLCNHLRALANHRNFLDNYYQEFKGLILREGVSQDDFDKAYCDFQKRNSEQEALLLKYRNNRPKNEG